MGIGMQFALGGLLGGIGKGITDETAARREAALAQAREQAADRRLATQNAFTASESALGRQNTRDINTDDNVSAVERLKVAGEYDIKKTHAAGAEARLTEETKFDYDKRMEDIKNGHSVGLAKLNSRLDTQQKKDLESLEGDDYAGTFQGKSGQIYIIRKDGRHDPTGIIGKLPKPGEDGEEGGGLAAELEKRGSGGKPASAPANTPVSGLPPPPDGRRGRTMTGPDGRKVYWNGSTWVPLTAANEAARLQLLNGK